MTVCLSPRPPEVACSSELMCSSARDTRSLSHQRSRKACRGSLEQADDRCDYVDSGTEEIFNRIKQDEGQGKERCHAKPMMSNEANERLKCTLNM